MRLSTLGHVGGRDCLQIPKSLRLAASGGQNIRWRTGIKDSSRHNVSNESLEIAVTQGIQHLNLLRIAGAEMPLQEGRNQRCEYRKMTIVRNIDRMLMSGSVHFC